MIHFIHIPKNGGTSLVKMLKENQMFKCHGHNFEVKTLSQNDKSLIVVRNPIDRFCSAVCYAIEKWSHLPHMKLLVHLKITEPEQFVQIYKNSKHPHHKFVANEINNKEQLINKTIIPYKYTYNHQKDWIHEPTYIILFENLNQELQLLFQKLNVECEIQHVNKSTNSSNQYLLSDDSIQFLNEFYKDDIVLYEKYKAMSVEERLKLNE